MALLRFSFCDGIDSFIPWVIVVPIDVLNLKGAAVHGGLQELENESQKSEGQVNMERANAACGLSTC